LFGSSGSSIIGGFLEALVGTPTKIMCAGGLFFDSYGGLPELNLKPKAVCLGLIYESENQMFLSSDPLEKMGSAGRLLDLQPISREPEERKKGKDTEKSKA
jgi:hypothetical protein